MTIGAGFTELARVASDYTNGGMNKQSAYSAVRSARQREASRGKSAAPKASVPITTPDNETPTNPAAGDVGDATPTPRGGMEVA